MQKHFVAKNISRDYLERIFRGFNLPEMNEEDPNKVFSSSVEVCLEWEP